MARGFEGEDESKRANDPISASDGLEQLREQIASAQAQGINVLGDAFQNKLAGDILSGDLNLGGGDDTRSAAGMNLAPVVTPRFTDRYRQADGTYSYPDLGSYLNAMGIQYGGFDQRNNLMGNVYNQLVPGGKTPLGALSAFPAAMGVNDKLAALISLGNLAAGKMGIGINEPKDEDEDKEEETKSNGIIDVLTGFQGHPGLR